MRLRAFSPAFLTRLLVSGGALVLVGSLLTWVVFSVQPLFGWTYPSGLDLGFGILTAFAGTAILALAARDRIVRDPRAAWGAFGLAWIALALTVIAMVVAMNHDPSDGLMFDGIGTGPIIVAVGTMLAALAGWQLAVRSTEPLGAAPGSKRPPWRSVALLTGGLLLWAEGFRFGTLLLWHAATGDSSQGPDFLGVGLEGWGGYFSVGGHQIGWDVAYAAFMPLAVASLLGSLALLGGRERPALVAAAVWFLVAVVSSLGSLRLSGFFWTQLVIFAVTIAGAWPIVEGRGRWLGHRRAEPHSGVP